MALRTLAVQIISVFAIVEGCGVMTARPVFIDFEHVDRLSRCTATSLTTLVSYQLIKAANSCQLDGRPYH